MIHFGALKLWTSSARWILQLLFAPLQQWTILFPPFFQRQILINPRAREFKSVIVSSYFDWATLHEIFVRREYSLESFAANAAVEAEYLGILKSGQKPLILDLGANVGFASMFFTGVYPEAKVIGLEPSETNQLKAVSNLRQSLNAEVQLAAISTIDGEIEFFDPGLGNNAFRTFGDKSQQLSTVKCRSVKSLIDEHSDLTPFLIKIDIEGFEKQLFAGDNSWVDEFKVIVIEIHDWMLPGQAISSNLMQALGGRDRDLVFRGENLFSIRND
jgi:FkbM family methyltransferase